MTPDPRQECLQCGFEYSDPSGRDRSAHEAASKDACVRHLRHLVRVLNDRYERLNERLHAVEFPDFDGGGGTEPPALGAESESDIDYYWEMTHARG